MTARALRNRRQLTAKWLKEHPEAKQKYARTWRRRQRRERRRADYKAVLTAARLLVRVIENRRPR